MTKVTELANNPATSPDELANAFLCDYYKEKQMVYPINPFKILMDLGIPFIFNTLTGYDGLYIPKENNDDIPIIGINIDHPITKQRFTAAHELCHHIKDANTTTIIKCLSNSTAPNEKYAERFAAALLMPLDELQKQVAKYIDGKFVCFDNILNIAQYFGVSFEACTYRIAYQLNAIEGNIDSKILKNRMKKFSPDRKRTELSLNHVKLYEDLFDLFSDSFSLIHGDNISYKFQNDYVYNDSRMEGIN